MRQTIVSCVLAAALALGASAATAADKPLIGIVSIAATEANNVRYIKGAEKAAAELGWEVSVIDAAGSADQANAGIQNFVQRGAHAIVDMVFPFSSIGAGLDAAKGAGPRDTRAAAELWREIRSTETAEERSARRYARRSLSSRSTQAYQSGHDVTASSCQRVPCPGSRGRLTR